LEGKYTWYRQKACGVWKKGGGGCERNEDKENMKRVVMEGGIDNRKEGKNHM
jgi:hypothetical protein